jgi:diguanylate cyclase (GGDEF)-like protein
MVFQDERPVDFVYLHVNRSFGALTGLRDVVGRKVTEVIPGIRESYPEMFETFAHVAMSGQPARFELYITQLRAWLSFSVYSTEKEHFITVFENITDRKNREEELRSQSLTDELTGLYNRRGFLTFAEKLGQMAKRQHKGLAMLYADIDGMKEINDTWGHQEGDAALVEIAGILRATYRESDVIARIGGDEFVVFPVGASGEDSETSLARLYHNIDAHNATRKKGYKLAMSCGLSYFDPANPLTINELLGHADRLMYDRKREARRRLNGEQ